MGAGSENTQGMQSADKCSHRSCGPVTEVREDLQCLRAAADRQQHIRAATDMLHERYPSPRCGPQCRPVDHVNRAESARANGTDARNEPRMGKNLLASRHHEGAWPRPIRTRLPILPVKLQRVRVQPQARLLPERLDRGRIFGGGGPQGAFHQVAFLLLSQSHYYYADFCPGGTAITALARPFTGEGESVPECSPIHAEINASTLPRAASDVKV